MLNYRLLRTVGMGVGSVLLATVVLPLVARAARPVIKSAIKGGLSLKDQMKEAYADNREEFDDLVDEVKEEETGKTKKSRKTKKTKKK